MKSKYAILVGDGMADFPIAELDNRTPLEYAETPFMDSIASQGVVGMAATVPQGMLPGSDVANLSLMGYDPKCYYSGRAPIEAASMGIKLGKNDTAFRCNLVTIKDGVMVDYSAGHVETSDAHQIIKELKQKLDCWEICFYPGVSYRHLLVIKDFPEGLECTPPHDITDKETAPYLPRGSGSSIALSLMDKAHELLASSPVNASRVASGKSPVTDIWLWGQGHALALPALLEKYGIRGSVISAVDLVRGLGVLAGLRVRMVEGATGYLGTNYAGKVTAACKALEEEDFVYLHVEAPDETSHQGSLQKKIQAIEEFDKFVVGEMVKFQKQSADLRILVAPDHATPVILKTHSAGPVPYAAAGPGIVKGKTDCYCEKCAQNFPVITGPELFERFLKGKL
jgi:2,3-bisphosphoglycerate-independent phosphoglycerate mutase